MLVFEKNRKGRAESVRKNDISFFIAIIMRAARSKTERTKPALWPKLIYIRIGANDKYSNAVSDYDRGPFSIINCDEV